MKIEMLVIDDCPNAEATVELVRETADELGIDASIQIINVIYNVDAVAKRFLGSSFIGFAAHLAISSRGNSRE